MPKIRVLIVDDSTFVRTTLSSVFAAEPTMEVVGTASNGSIALKRIPQLNPDIIILDVEMPEMDGLATLVHIRKDYPRLPIIMFSSLTQRGAEVTLEAISLGASDYVTKPTQTNSFDDAIQQLKKQLIPKVSALCCHKEVAPAPAPSPVAPRVRSHGLPHRIDALVIGVSTGGPNALGEVIPRIPANFPVPIFIVQHMPPVFTKHLANRLAAQSQIPVVEATDGQLVKPGMAFIAPGDYHMCLQRKDTDQVVISLNQGPVENSCRPAVDVLFRSAVTVYRERLLAAVLTGMGYDGQRGCELIAQVGGEVLAQDEASSVVWGMPGAVVEAGLANQVLTLSAVAPAIVKRVMELRVSKNSQQPLTSTL